MPGTLVKVAAILCPCPTASLQRVAFHSPGGQMTEILTESFCERCGSRYTFESSAPRKSRAGRLKVFSKGVRNFVLTDDSSFSEAMAEARSEEEQAATVHQLDAFHKTFNFCLGCRQYTCGSCWNTGEGRCLTCAPDPALEAAATVSAQAAEGAAERIALAAETPGAIEGGPFAADTWPDQDVPVDRLARAIGAPSATGTESPETSPAVDAAREAEAAVLADAEVPAPPETLERSEEQAIRAEADETGEQAIRAEAATDDSAPAPASVRGVAPGQTLQEAIAAWEAGQLAEDVPVDATVEPEPVAAMATESAPDADDVVPQPTWPTPVIPAQPQAPPAQPQAPTAPTAPTPAAPAPWLTVAPDNGPHEPQWPTTPAWPRADPRQYAPTTLAGRPLLPQGDIAAVWAASAREVLSAAPASLPAAAAAPTAQPCIACGLSLSANARFCRRCGSRQT